MLFACNDLITHTDAIMTPDEQGVYPEIARIREALWGSSGSATVMIGAGFSRQAQPVLPNAPPFPLWTDLKKRMEIELGLISDDPREVTDVAQFYEERFGRVALDQLIIQHIPDESYVPGENHIKLLQLNWADVFTTNYDTLLERAAAEVFHRRYERIVAHEDIPLRSSPRIVKLHGSFPSTRPFVITRNDYREYHTKRAPFVNLVQQSVMETVFVLLGFSGDDPNFKTWADWVKAQLGNHAPPIYLCGVLDLTPEKRAAIVARHVTPIDLGPLFPKTQFQQRDARRSAALKWLLDVWERGQPAEPLEWAPFYALETPSLHPAGPAVVRFTPSPERLSPNDNKLSAKQLGICLSSWRSQRAEYPGWIVAPDRSRERIWESIRYLRSTIFKSLNELQPWEQFQLLRELVWRLDLSLVSLNTTETETILKFLEQWNAFPRILDISGSQTIPQNEAWGNASEDWIELAVAALRTLREDFIEKKYELWFSRLEKLSAEWPSLIPRLVAERAYWELARLDLEKLDAALESWRGKDHTPWGRAKLAALYGEMGQLEKALEIATTALKEVRRYLAALHSKLELVSLEAWLVHLVEMLDGKWAQRSPAVRDRLAELRRLGCDPEQTRETLQQELRDEEPTRDPIESESLSFDPGPSQRTRRLNSWGVRPENLVSAFSVLRLIEVAPHPLTTRRMSWLSHEAARAAVWLEFVAPFWTLGFIVRTDRKESRDRYMHRAHVALMPADRVDQYWTLLSRLVRQSLERVPDSHRKAHDTPACHFGDVGLELLSRIAFRLRPEQQADLFQILLDWLRSDRIAKMRLFQDAIENLLTRFVFAVPSERLGFVAVELLGTPILEENGFGHMQHAQWPEVSDVLLDRGDYPPSCAVPNELVARLGRVIETAESTPTQRAAARALFLIERGWLSSDQIRALEASIWKRRQEPDGLPLHLSELGVRSCLRFPGAIERGLELIARKHVFQAPLPSLKAADSSGYEVGVLSRICRRLERVRNLGGMFFGRPPTVAMNTQDALVFLTEAKRWWAMNANDLLNLIDKTSFIFEAVDVHAMSEFFTAVAGDVLLPALRMQPEVVGETKALLQTIRTSGFSTARASIGLLTSASLSEEEAVEEIGRMLLGETPRDIQHGGWLILSWSRAHREGMTTIPPPPKLIELLVQRVALRADPGLDRACYWLAALVRETGLMSESRDLLLHALRTIANTTDLNIWREAFAKGTADRQRSQHLIQLRTHAAMLAGAMYDNTVRTGRSPEPTLEQWRELAATDPLPEVRRAWATID